MDIENMEPVADIDNLDLSTLDRGDNLEPPAAEKPDDKTLDAEEKKVVEDVTGEKEDKGDEEEGEEEESEEQPRDEKGRFDKKEARIPKSRFDEAVGKEREAREAAERKAAELERQLLENEASKVQSQQVAELEGEIEKLEKQHADLLLDGEAEKAAKVMREIRQMERKIATAEAETRANARLVQTLEKDRLDTTIARIEADYPMLNPESEAFDEDMVELVLAKQRGYITTQGFSPSQALAKAASEVMSRFGKVAEPEPEKKGLAKDTTVEDRKAKQVEKNLETAKRQPPSTKEVGMDSDKAGLNGLPDVSAMTAEEFAALPAATLVKLRGDLL